jgi:hypothetical protein
LAGAIQLTVNFLFHHDLVFIAQPTDMAYNSTNQCFVAIATLKNADDSALDARIWFSGECYDIFGEPSIEVRRNIDFVSLHSIALMLGCVKPSGEEDRCFRGWVVWRASDA